MLSIRAAWKFSNNKAVNVFWKRKANAFWKWNVIKTQGKRTSRMNFVKRNRALNAETCVNSWHTLSISVVLFFGSIELRFSELDRVRKSKGETRRGNMNDVWKLRLSCSSTLSAGKLTASDIVRMANETLRIELAQRRARRVVLPPQPNSDRNKVQAQSMKRIQMINPGVTFAYVSGLQHFPTEDSGSLVAYGKGLSFFVCQTQVETPTPGTRAKVALEY